MRFIGVACAAAFAAATMAMTGAVPSSAAPMGALSLMKPAGAEQSMVEKTHGWHRSCRRGLNGWHRHVPGVGRIQCTSRRCWTNRFGVRRCSWS